MRRINDKEFKLNPSELLQWRKKNNYSQIALGRVLGVATITVYRWEKGMREIPSFLHLALKYLETKGGEPLPKGKRKTSK